MSEAYQQKEWELNNLIDNLNSIEYTYEKYKKEVEHFIDRLLEDTKEINTLRNENKRLNNILNELEKWLEMEIKRIEELQNPAKSKVKPYGEEYNNYTLIIGTYDNALDKLQKLKGDGDSENL